MFLATSSRAAARSDTSALGRSTSTLSHDSQQPCLTDPQTRSFGADMGNRGSNILAASVSAFHI
jgi:hypothetical protein